MKFLEHPVLLLVVAVLSLPVYRGLAKAFWGERYESLGETLKYLFMPDLISLFRGKFWEDWGQTRKFNAYLLLCIGWVAAVTEFVARHVL